MPQTPPSWISKQVQRRDCRIENGMNDDGRRDMTGVRDEWLTARAALL